MLKPSGSKLDAGKFNTTSTLLSSVGRKGQNILKEFDDHHDEARYLGDY